MPEYQTSSRRQLQSASSASSPGRSSPSYVMLLLLSSLNGILFPVQRIPLIHLHEIMRAGTHCRSKGTPARDQRDGHLVRLRLCADGRLLVPHHHGLPGRLCRRRRHAAHHGWPDCGDGGQLVVCSAAEGGRKCPSHCVESKMVVVNGGKWQRVEIGLEEGGGIQERELIGKSGLALGPPGTRCAVTLL